MNDIKIKFLKNGGFVIQWGFCTKVVESDEFLTVDEERISGKDFVKVLSVGLGYLNDKYTVFDEEGGQV